MASLRGVVSRVLVSYPAAVHCADLVSATPMDPTIAELSSTHTLHQSEKRKRQQQLLLHWNFFHFQDLKLVLPNQH